MGFPGGSEVKASAWNVGDLCSIPVSGRSPGEGNGNPLQHSCLENPMEGGAQQATVHGVTKSQTGLSDFTHSLTHSLTYIAVVREKMTLKLLSISPTLSWSIPLLKDWRRKWQPTPVFWPEKSHGQKSLEGYNPQERRVRHNWSDLALL